MALGNKRTFISAADVYWYFFGASCLQIRQTPSANRSFQVYVITKVIISVLILMTLNTVEILLFPYTRYRLKDHLRYVLIIMRYCGM